MSARPPRSPARLDGDDADARLDACLLRARPREARGRAADASAVRVLARVAALEGATSAARPPAARPPAARRARTSGAQRRTAFAAGLAAGLVALVVASRLGGPASAGRREAAPLSEVVLSEVVLSEVVSSEGVLSVGVLSEGVLSEGASAVDSSSVGSAPRPGVAAAGPRVPTEPAPAEVRDRWLTIAEGHASDAGDALRALARLGGPCGGEEARRVAALHRDDALAAVVREVLAATPGDAGPQALANMLVDAQASDRSGAMRPDVVGPRASRDAALVRALERVARAGRATLALDGLRRAADAGCAAAAVGCLRVAGTPELDRALALVAAHPATQPAVVEAVTLRPRVLGAALLRRVERGDRSALALAAAARVEGLAAVVRPFLADPARAVGAVDALVVGGDVSSVETLALGLGGPADGEARRALASLGAPAVATLEAAAAAAATAGDGAADPYVAALAGLGDAALPSLVALADRPTLAVRVVRALAASKATGASDALAALASRPPLTRAAVDALGARRAAGDPRAPAALVEAGRGDAARSGASPSSVPTARPDAPPLEPTSGPSSAGRPAADAGATGVSGRPSPLRPPSSPSGGGEPSLRPPVVFPPTGPSRPEAPLPRPTSSPAPPSAGGRSRSI